MQNVGTVAAAAACLFSAQALLVLFRSCSCLRPPVPLLLAGFLLAMTARLTGFGGTAVQEVLLVIITWLAGAFLIRAATRRMFARWASGCLALCLTLLLARALGPEKAAPYIAFRSFGIVVAAAVPLGMLFATWRRTRCVQVFVTFIAGAAWLAAGAARTIGAPLAAEPVCAPWDPRAPRVVVHRMDGLPGGLPAEKLMERKPPGAFSGEALAPSLFARMLESESALGWQERVTTAGFLALGAAHELKNVLSNVRLAVTHGLSQPDPGRKDECLRLVAQAAETGQDTAIAVLDRLASGAPGESCIMDAARDLRGPLRRAGSVLRGEGIVIQAELGEGVGFRARRFDVEQIVLNLIHNAAEGYRRRPGDDTRLITVCARAVDEWTVIEVRDAAGGVPESFRHCLFTLAASASGSSGLGLYMSRNLAIANGGSLDYEPIDGGSVFRLSLPGAG